jgi:hypothetical protein
MLDGVTSTKGGYAYYPILSSIARLQGDVADLFIVYPRYKFVVYSDANYGRTTTTFNNYTGTTPQVAAIPSTNTADSIKVFYMNDSNEITLLNIS